MSSGNAAIIIKNLSDSFIMFFKGFANCTYCNSCCSCYNDTH